MLIGKHDIDFKSPKVMAIVNLTPDSFFDGGCYSQSKTLEQHISKVIEDGADIVDLGAYSTRPGADIVSEEEEWRRLIPALTFIRKHYTSTPISIDTFRASVAEKARCYFGDFIVNDISAGTLDKDLFPWVGKYKMPYVLMHIQGSPQTMQQNPTYGDVVSEVYKFLSDKLIQLKKLGAKDIIIDPGFGFGKTLKHNYTLLEHLTTFKEIAAPILVGISRKSMIYKTLETTAKQALNGTTVLHTIALERGAKILRVHDVKEAKEVIKLMSALQNS